MASSITYHELINEAVNVFMNGCFPEMRTSYTLLVTQGLNWMSQQNSHWNISNSEIVTTSLSAWTTAKPRDSLQCASWKRNFIKHLPRSPLSCFPCIRWSPRLNYAFNKGHSARWFLSDGAPTLREFNWDDLSLNPSDPLPHRSHQPFPAASVGGCWWGRAGPSKGPHATAAPCEKCDLKEPPQLLRLSGCQRNTNLMTSLKSVHILPVTSCTSLISA